MRQWPVDDGEGKNIISSNITAIRSQYQVNTVGALISDGAVEMRKAAERTKTIVALIKTSVGIRKLNTDAINS